MTGETGQATLTQFEGPYKEISRGDFMIAKLENTFGALNGKLAESDNSKEKRGSQESGITFTSEFAINGDGPKTDARSGSQGSVNIDGITAAFSALNQSGKALNILDPNDFPDLAAFAKDLVDATKNFLQSTKPDSKKNKPADESMYPPGSDSCTECQKVEESDSMNHHSDKSKNYHTEIKKTKSYNKIQKSE